MRTLKTSEAAAVLNVSPNTLRAWERRFGYPKPQRSPGKHRLYTHGEIAALRDALQEGLSISSAISRARESVAADTHVLVGALAAYELERADAAMEGALALRSVERSVEEVLLPSLEEIGDRHGTESAPWALAARWAGEWLLRAQRLSPPASSRPSVLLGDATRDQLDPDALALRALELCTTRVGLRTVTLPVTGLAGLGDVLGAYAPRVVVIAGGEENDDHVARWAYRVRAAAGALPVLLFHRSGRGDRTRTTGARHLAAAPTLAASQLLDLVEGSSREVSGGEDAAEYDDHAHQAPAPRRMSA
ncbi:MAG TPA: MerR family transcriptional regulator [Baekduia sp.]|uniref:MerR family transcriptional regulator n=1 Tax=Baekduia sp. TaxID=2600305 RepID=UPI002D775957|nr:MerR family transcriptional regulator [Baekduia sp.]HET6508654.1 MerR family transcriptional regulator [Baekduia sp.]